MIYIMINGTIAITQLIVDEDYIQLHTSTVVAHRIEKFHKKLR
jgi:hypothetical protein